MFYHFHDCLNFSDSGTYAKGINGRGDAINAYILGNLGVPMVNE
jgi:hypothetical protein